MTPDWVPLLAMLAVWWLLQLVVFPALGVPT